MTRLLLLLAALAATPASAADVCPPFPERGAQIIDALVPKFPGGAPGGTDDDRRALTRAIIEQLVYEQPDAGWTWKSADPRRPPSKDALARTYQGRLCVWDWQNGATRQRDVQPGKLGEDITGQNPIPVAGVNHLEDRPAPPPVVSVPPAGPLDLSPLVTALAASRRQHSDEHADLQDAIEAQLKILAAQLAEAERKADALSAQLERHDKSPSWWSQVFGNRYVQMFLAAAAAAGTARSME